MTRLRTNAADLVAVNIAGRVAPARFHPEAMPVGREGHHRLLPGTGGIALGVHAGDPVDRWVADHLMPGASIEDANGTPAVAGPLHLLSTIGNRVRDAKGATVGVVAGKRGGLAPGFWAPQLVGVEISNAVAASLMPEDRIVVETVGRGLRLLDYPDITLINLSPRLLEALPLTQTATGLQCVVSAATAAEVAGAGLGQDSWIGDLEIADRGDVLGLHFGDLVAFHDIDSAVTRHYAPGSISIGIVSHGPSLAPGHGIGVTILLTGPASRLEAVPGDAGLGRLLIAWSTEMGGSM
jgi:hypothetical protein